MSAQVWQWSAVETAAAIRDGLITSEEVVLAHVERMHAINPALNAVVVDLSEQAISAARARPGEGEQHSGWQASRRAGDDQDQYRRRGSGKLQRRRRIQG